MSSPPERGGEPERAGAPERAGPPKSDLLHRLDPDLARRRAGLEAGDPASPEPEPDLGPASRPAIDTRRYGWMIGIFGLVLVVVVSIYQFATHGVGTTGVPAGQRVHYFAAPLAASNLSGDPNVSPPCTLARHDPRALNICLLAGRAPLVLAFFVTGSSQCTRQVDVMQTLAAEFSPRTVQFAAVAVNASHAEVAALVRSHHWTIPVAYDRDGAIGALYGIALCPMLELVHRGGIVQARLIGGHWQTAALLGAPVRTLLRSATTS